MVFSIFIILLVGLVAFFHYVQGFFSATLSAFIAVIAAIMAVSYHETVIQLLLKGKMADYAHGMVLCMIFAVVYLILRVIFDAAIPGNVRTPSVVDKVGAGLMGLVAGTFTVGIFAIAVQTLPWDPGMSFLGYSRYPLTGTRTTIVPVANGRQQQDTHIDNEMIPTTMEPTQTPMWLPVDDIVLATVAHVTNGGSLEGDRPLTSIHPDYLQELFGERIGIQTGGRRVALAINGNDPVEVSAVFTATELPAKDGGLKELRPGQDKYKAPLLEKGQVKMNADQKLLVVRVKVNGNATDDEDQLFRFSTGSIHLVGPTADGSFADFYPIGTLEGGTTVLLNKPDDFLFVKADDSFDAVFLVDKSVITADNKVAQGSFISVKRFGLVDLAGKTIATRITPSASVKVLRHGVLVQELSLPPAPAATPSSPGTPSTPSTPSAQPTPVANVPPPVIGEPTPAVPATPQPTADRPIAQDLSASIGNSLASSLQLGTTANDQEAKDAPVPGGGKMTLVGGQIGSASVDPNVSISDLAQGVQQSGQLIEPGDKKMVQVQVQQYTPGWDLLSDMASLAVVDSNGNKYPPSGIYAIVKANDAKGLLLRYDYMHGGMNITTPSNPPDGSIYLIFLIPHDTDLKSLTVGGKTQNLDSPVKVP